MQNTNENANKDQDKLVQCRKTGVWYNPDQKFEELKKEQWFIDQLIRMKNK